MKRCQVPLRVAVGEQARDVAEPERRVVADRLGRREVGERRVERSSRCCVRSLTPSVHQRVLGEALQRLEGRLQPLVERDRALAASGVPTSSASARSGAARAQRADAGPQLAEQPRRCSPGTAAAAGSRVIAGVQRGRAARRSCPGCTGARRSASARERRVEVAEQLGLRLGDGRDARPPCARAPGRSARRPRLRVGEVAHDRRRGCVSSGLSSSIAWLRSCAAAGEARCRSSWRLPAGAARASSRRTC